MSLIDIRSAYRDVFQTLRAVGRFETDNEQSRTATSASSSDKTSRSDQPGVVVTLSGNRIESEEAAKEDPRVTALSEKKGRARAKLEELMKRIKLTRKVWQYQPKELAKQLVALTKQLKEIVDEYKSAQKELAKLQGSLGAGSGLPAGLGSLTIPPPAAAATEEASEADQAGEASTDVEAAAETDASAASQHVPDEAETVAAHPGSDPEAEEDTAAEDTSSPERPFSYGNVKFERIRLDQTPEAYQLRSDIEFAQEAKGLMEEIKDGFRDAKRWAIGFKQTSKDDQKFFEEVEDFLKDFDKELRDYEGELKRAMPPAIWVSRPVAAA